jgi:hypothetical protein
MASRSTSFRRDYAFKIQLVEIGLIHEDIDHPHWVGIGHIVSRLSCNKVV